MRSYTVNTAFPGALHTPLQWHLFMCSVQIVWKVGVCLLQGQLCTHSILYPYTRYLGSTRSQRVGRSAFASLQWAQRLIRGEQVPACCR